MTRKEVPFWKKSLQIRLNEYKHKELIADLAQYRDGQRAHRARELMEKGLQFEQKHLSSAPVASYSIPTQQTQQPISSELEEIKVFLADLQHENAEIKKQLQEQQQRTEFKQPVPEEKPSKLKNTTTIAGKRKIIKTKARIVPEETIDEQAPTIEEPVENPIPATNNEQKEAWTVPKIVTPTTLGFKKSTTSQKPKSETSTFEDNLGSAFDHLDFD